VGVETGTQTASLLFEPLSPNPFTPATSLKFGLVRSGRISVQVFDAGGRMVRSLFSGRKAAGNYALTWDGRDEAGRSVGSGVYHFQLIVNGKRTIKRAVLVR
jgi:flagellar hook assembly protein FlgD